MSTPSPQSPTVIAALWMGGAIVSFSSMAVAGRAVSIDLDTFETMFYRSLIGLVIVLTVGGLSGTLHQITPRRIGAHIGRNLCHFTGQNLWFYAITVIPLAQVFALEFTTPLWVTLLAPLFLGERLTARRALAAAVGFVGILIVARPDFDQINPGMIAVLLAAIGFAGTAIFTKRLTRTETITCILFWLTALQAVFGAICAGFDGDITLPNGSNALALLIIGCAGLFAHFCLTKALSIAPAMLVMPIDFLRLPVIAIVGILLYDEALEFYVFLGGALIFAANYFNLGTDQRPKKHVS